MIIRVVDRWFDFFDNSDMEIYVIFFSEFVFYFLCYLKKIFVEVMV